MFREVDRRGPAILNDWNASCTVNSDRRLGTLVCGNLKLDAEDFLQVIPGETLMNYEKFRNCLDACFRCAVDCEHCGDVCVDHVGMAGCVRTCRDCAELCRVCIGYMGRGSGLASAVCQVCAAACDRCAAECGEHQAEHCKRCAESCRRCAEECRKMAA